MRYPSCASWSVRFLCLFFAGEIRAEEPDAEVAPEPAGQLSERDGRILGLFTATQKSLKDGRLRLVYEFESQNQELTEDWRPAINPNDMRIRWLRGSEGTPTTVEHGICIGDYGEWIHEAVFLPDGIEVTVDLMNYSPHKAGSICAPTFVNEKKKMSLGANMGHQVVCLRGWKAAKPPHPKKETKVTATSRYKSGYRLRGGIFEAIHNGKKTADSASLSKFTDGFDRGRVGLAWSGSVQSFVFSVTMEGALDPEWVASQLGEQSEKKSNTKAKSAPKSKADKKKSPGTTGTKPPEADEAASKKSG